MNNNNYVKAFFLSMMLVLTGCLESSFQLSEESRLPRWFSVSDELKRDSVSVQMNLYSTFSGGKVVFKLYKKESLLDIKKYTVTTKEQPNIRSVQLSGAKSLYPRYKVVTINGITDIVELRKMEPVFYMTDDPAVWRELVIEQ